MSWLFDPSSTGLRRYYNEEQEGKKVEDYSGRKVSTRTSNQPFLAYTRYREEQRREHEAWLKRTKEREVRQAKGERVGPEEPGPTEPMEIGPLGLLKFIVYCLIFLALVGKFFTGSFLFNYESDLPSLRKLWPTNQRLFTEEGLAKFDGSDPHKPIYLAIDGDVYDVTEGKRNYGPGGSYHFMAGRDAARAFATGCFETHRTHDVRGLSEKELMSLNHWKSFFANHKKYGNVGRVLHHPIDPASPILEDCKQRRGASNEAWQERSETIKSQKKHVEL